MSHPFSLANLRIRSDEDLVAARRRVREVAELLGFRHQEQVRIATAVSEIVRNALRYGGGGEVSFMVDAEARKKRLVVEVTDRGPGIEDLDSVLSGRYRSTSGMGLGIVGARRLMDGFSIETSSQGTSVRMSVDLPLPLNMRKEELRDKVTMLISSSAVSSMEELQIQNRELVEALDWLDERQQEIQRLNRELEETNRGVLALYAELDEKAESLRKASEMKSRFLSNMSHEFRTPLNSIISLSGLLEMGADGTLSPEQLRQVGYIRSAAQALSDMVNDLLDLAKIESGRATLDFAEVDIGRTFATLRGMFRPLFDHEKVSFQVIDPDPPFQMVTDEAKLGQILRNFVSNAMKFTDRGSVRIEASLQNGGVEIRVSDTGIGIPEENLQPIFEEFTQVANPLQKSKKGTGLGLPLSRQLASLLGGSISVESRVGEGSVFTLKLPLVHPSAPRRKDPGVLPEADEGMRRVLIIDDEEPWRYIFRSLVPDGWVVEEAESGAEGIRIAESWMPDTIVLDLVMPGQTGVEVLERLAQHPALSAIPVWIYSSKMLIAEERARLMQNASGIISKSHSTTQEGRRVIREALESAGVRSRNIGDHND